MRWAVAAVSQAICAYAASAKPKRVISSEIKWPSGDVDTLKTSS
jgi:hypothetical protein